MNKVHVLTHALGVEIVSKRLEPSSAMELTRTITSANRWVEGQFLVFCDQSIQLDLGVDIDQGGVIAPDGDANSWLIGTVEAIARATGGLIFFEDRMAQTVDRLDRYHRDIGGERYWIADAETKDFSSYWRGVWFNPVPAVTGFVLDRDCNPSSLSVTNPSVTAESLHAIVTTLFDGETYLVWQRRNRQSDAL
ncbi:MAG TPA: hypothetical protein PKA20_13910 [Burkholderiaceae bacterium]|nr:hypothetical protein [Burkholderiaceae bacterium]